MLNLIKVKSEISEHLNFSKRNSGPLGHLISTFFCESGLKGNIVAFIKYRDSKYKTRVETPPSRSEFIQNESRYSPVVMTKCLRNESRNSPEPPEGRQSSSNFYKIRVETRNHKKIISVIINA